MVSLHSWAQKATTQYQMSLKTPFKMHASNEKIILVGTGEGKDRGTARAIYVHVGVSLHAE